MSDDDLPAAPAAPARRERPLPLPLTAFFGREEEMARVTDLLHGTEGRRAARLLTLIGTGGSGKTRLALEAATHFQQALAVGEVWFVPLADIADARLIPDRIAEVMGLEAASGRDTLEQVAEALARRGRLLVLDNFEQIAEEGAGVLLSLLRRAPELSLLVTSRRRLALPGEQVVAVPPLPTPERVTSPEEAASLPERLRQSPAVQLFIDRAQAAHPDFQVTARNATSVADLCRALEGLPLAIELAAARASVLTPAQMLDRLTQRFDLLTNRRSGGVRDHHRSLWATLDWSYRLLSPELARFFVRLSAFRGGWTAKSAAIVCEEPRALEYLTQLRVHSLVLGEEPEEPFHKEMRFRLLEAVREFGWAQQDEEERRALALSHANCLLGFVNMPSAPAEDGGVNPLPLRISDTPRWMALVRPDLENVRAALQFCLLDSEEGDSLLGGTAESGSPSWIGVRLAAAMGKYWWISGQLAEGRRWLAAALRHVPESEVRGRGDLRYWAGILAWANIDFEAANEHLQAALADLRAVDSSMGIAMCLNALGIVAVHQGAANRAVPLLEESLALHRRSANRYGEALALLNLGSAARALGQFAVAESHHDESLRLYRAINDTWGIANALFQLGLTHLRSGEGEESSCEKAFSLLTTAFDRFEAIGERWGCATTLLYLADIHLREGDPGTARTSLERSVEGFRDIGNRPSLLRALFLACLAAEREGEASRVRPFLTEALRLGREQADVVLPMAHAAAALLRADLAYFARLRCRWREAALLLGAAESAADETTPCSAERAEWAITAAAVRAALGVAAYDSLLARGRCLSREALLDCVRACCSLSHGS